MLRACKCHRKVNSRRLRSSVDFASGWIHYFHCSFENGLATAGPRFRSFLKIFFLTTVPDWVVCGAKVVLLCFGQYFPT